MATKKPTKKKTTKNKAVEQQIQQQNSFIIPAGPTTEERNAILANEYFNGVKTKAELLNDETIAKELNYLPAQIEELIELGQTGLANKLKSNIQHLVNERILLNNGFDKFVHRKDITRYIELVKDKKVHVCELDKFPRLIPDAAKQLLKKARSLEVFQDFWVVYVDYSDDQDSALTEQEKQQRKKNRDPIIFGTFEKPEKATLDKMYFVCDWTDEYCDLTLDKMVKELVKNDKNYKPSVIVKDIDKYINNVLMELNPKTKETFTEKVRKFFGFK